MVSQFFEDLGQKIYAALADDANTPVIEPAFVGFAKQELLDYLAGLEVGKRISSSPLIKTIAKDELSVTFLIRGRMRLNKSRFAPFVRIEVRVSATDVGIDAVTTFIAELKIVESELSPVTEVHMGLGYDGLTFTGRGGARVLPVGLGLDIFLGGVSDRGIMIGIDVFLPVPIPLGPTGLGLNGIGGDYAHNFKPRIEAGLEAEGPKLDLETGEGGEETPVGEIQNPTAIHYLQWARNPDEALDRWVPAPEQETAVGIAVRSFLCDVPMLGALFQIEPAGFTVLTPGAILILGGEGKLLNADAITLDALAVIDSSSGSFALGGGVELKIPESGAVAEAQAVFESFFSRVEPTTWFVRIGSEQDPAKANFLIDFSGKLYIELNHYRVVFGAEIIWKEKIELAKIFEVFVKANGVIRGLLGWNPRQIAAELKLAGEAGFKVWKFKLSASLSVSVWGHVPQPRVLEATGVYKLNGPFPLKPVKITVKLPREHDNVAPKIELPFGEVAQRAGAMHGPSGRQWDLSEPDLAPENQPWPDATLTIPFSSRLTDETGKILGPAIGPQTQGGYDVHHRLTRLEITDLTNGTVVEGVQAVWAEGPTGETAQLHVLGRDPYSWLFWNESVSISLDVPDPTAHLQLFGVGNNQVLDSTTRFGKLRVTPAPDALLNNDFGFALPRRVISGRDLTLQFRTGAELPIAADKIWFYVIEYREELATAAHLTAPDAPSAPLAIAHHEIFPGVYLVTYQLDIPPGEAMDELQITALEGAGPLHLYGVLFREIAVTEQSCQERVILTPGRYRLEMEGTTSATSLDGLAEPEEQDWVHDWEFDVVYPYSLRPYLRDTTVGDGRIIRDEKLSWNPTLFGIGFPAYRGYLPAVRFVVPYLSDIFPTLRYRLVYEEEGLANYSFTAEPVENATGENSLLEPSEDFLDWIGCPIDADQELEGPEPLPAAGPAEVQLIFDEPGGTARRLDGWNCYVSQFSGFVAHMALSQKTLTRVYDTEGPRGIAPCFTPGDIGFTARRSIGGGRMDPILTAPRTSPPDPTAPLLPQGGPVFENLTFPAELSVPPLTWRLPAAMAQHLDDDSVPLPVAFARFARASGAVFSEFADNPHFGLANTVEETTVEAIMDGQGRPYALWLRTPEPVDWRRVEGALKIRHLKGEGACATELAFRMPLSLAIEILPGPDASSAFIVGSLAGVRTRLPRGEYELTLAFDPTVKHLPPLRPGPGVAGPEETAMLKFLQVSGQNWPSPQSEIAIPAILFEAILAGIDPEAPQMRDLLAQATRAADGGDVSQMSLPSVPPTAERPVMPAVRGAPAASTVSQRRRRPRVSLRGQRVTTPPACQKPQDD